MNILIVRNAYSPEAQDACLMLQLYLEGQGVSCTCMLADDAVAEATGVERFDMAIALGGDGTVLKAAEAAGYSRTPVLGLNFGHLGFLTSKADDGVVAIAAAALSGDAVREERSNLRIDVLCEGDDEYAFEQACLAPFAEASALPAARTFFALNDLSVERGDAGHSISLALGVSGTQVMSMKGNGVVVASATGSTAYALSAGGPLVAPGFGGMVVVPVAPHTLKQRPLITDPADVVEVDLADHYANNEARLFADGRALEFDVPVRKVRVTRGEAPTVLLRYKHQGFYAHAHSIFFA